MTEIFNYKENFSLESGYIVQGFHLAYSTHGKLNDDRDNVVWVFHALTANSDPQDWWSGLVGPGKIFDPANDFIICVNMPGSCYGSIGPLENNTSGKTWYHDFPLFTTRDMIRTYQHLRTFLGIRNINVGIGGSMGGQQLLEWAVEEPGLFANIIPIACNAQHSPWGIAFNAAQRQSIELDASWPLNHMQAGIKGMQTARSIALLSYRNYDTYRLFQTDEDDAKTAGFKSDSYQRYQGEKLAQRFNAFSYYFLSQSMDAHNLGRERGGAARALGLIRAKAMVIGIQTDVLFPVLEQEFIASNISDAAFRVIESKYGHDGFLLEFEQIAGLIQSFLKNYKLQPAGSINR